jgi:hypothetical protein
MTVHLSQGKKRILEIVGTMICPTRGSPALKSTSHGRVEPLVWTMIANALLNSVPDGYRRRWLFVVAGIACIPAVVVFAVQVALARNAQSILAFTLLGTSSLLGVLIHTCLAWAVHSGRKLPLRIADLLIILGFPLACAGIIVLATQ